jgi:hypothetical protein
MAKTVQDNPDDVIVAMPVGALKVYVPSPPVGGAVMVSDVNGEAFTVDTVTN